VYRGAVSRARTADIGAGPKSNTTLPGPVEPVQNPVGGGALPSRAPPLQDNMRPRRMRDGFTAATGHNNKGRR
jgi:hypothetical protein